MKTHDLKCLPEYFEEVYAGRKKFELRKNDRNYQPGNLVVLREWLPEKGLYSGRRYWAQIGYVLKEFGDGLYSDWCIFDLSHGSRIQRRKYDKIYRLNRIDLRNKNRKRNYDRSKIISVAKRRPTGIKHKIWTHDEDDLIVDNDIKKLSGFQTDRHLSIHLERSVQAIQQRRYKLKKEM